jgi:dCMP deaminase
MKKCKKCEHRVYGHAFSNTNCKYCGKEIINSHTPGDTVCFRCAELYDVCMECGVSLDTTRPTKNSYYLNIAKGISERGTCLRRNYGAIIIKNDEIISTGYTGAPRGRKNCTDIGACKRQELNIPSGERYELCRSVHAEMNAIISAARKDTIGATMYLYGYDKESNQEIQNPRPCKICERMIINAGITSIITLTEFINVKDLMIEGE